MLLSRRQVTIEQKQSVGDSMQHLDLHFYCELWFKCRPTYRHCIESPLCRTHSELANTEA